MQAAYAKSRLSVVDSAVDHELSNVFVRLMTRFIAVWTGFLFLLFALHFTLGRTFEATEASGSSLRRGFGRIAVL